MPPLIVLLGTLLALAAAPTDPRALLLAVLLPAVTGLQGSRRDRKAAGAAAAGGKGGKGDEAGKPAKVRKPAKPARGSTGSVVAVSPTHDELSALACRQAEQAADDALFRRWVREVSPAR